MTRNGANQDVQLQQRQALKEISILPAFVPHYFERSFPTEPDLKQVLYFMWCYPGQWNTTLMNVLSKLPEYNVK